MHSIEEDPRWQAVLIRDGAADGRFVYSVASTGIYCRPTCPARRPASRHVAFHATAAEARAQGFRPCKRCMPDGEAPAERLNRAILAACRSLETADAPPALETLAQAAGLSPYHFHRQFRRIIGLTPRGYYDAHRAGRLRQALREEASVTTAFYDAGFAAPSRFYAQSDALLGMRPSAYRKGGEAVTIEFAFGEGTLGQVLVAQSARGICAILMGDDRKELEADLRRRFRAADVVPASAAFATTLAAVLRFLDNAAGTFTLPLDVAGTAFQQRVWNALRAIPPGTTVSYAELAARLGAPKAVRAVAGACAANPVAVAVPCHRVVRADGGLSGYRWGIRRKRALLAREGAKTGED